MTKLVGTGSTLDISTDGGSTYVEIANITNIGPTIDQNEIDSTDNDDAGWKSNLAGDKQFTLSVDCFYSEEDPGQDAVMDAIYDGTKPTWRYRTQVGSGKKQKIFTGLVTSVNDPSPHGEAVTFSFEVKSTGTVAKSNQ
jgi:TP901-1 family phage major tail protein